MILPEAIGSIRTHTEIKHVPVIIRVSCSQEYGQIIIFPTVISPSSTIIHFLKNTPVIYTKLRSRRSKLVRCRGRSNRFAPFRRIPPNRGTTVHIIRRTHLKTHHGSHPVQISKRPIEKQFILYIVRPGIPIGSQQLTTIGQNRCLKLS